jgi:uncharacterized protein (TIGR03435 family)
MVSWAGLGCLLALQAAYAQGQPQFDAASVKQVEYAGHVEMDSDAGRIDYRHIGIKALVWVAFPVTPWQIVWPEGLVGNARFYDVSATFPPGTPKERQQLMLQGLLAERFRLAAHMETRDEKVYALVVSGRGLRIHKSDNPPDEKALTISVHTGKDGFYLNDRLPDAPASAPYGITVSKLVQYFNNDSGFDRVVVDKTGLDGYYDINLFIPPPPEADSAADSGGKLPDMQTFSDALEKQLGLRVEKRTAPIAMLIIDHLETVPAEN